MAALTGSRDTKVMGTYDRPTRLSVPVKDLAKIYPGAMVCTQGGYAIQGKIATDLKPVGVYDGASVLDNSAGVTGHADGFLTCPVRTGVFKMDNDTGTALTQADCMATCYVLDDHTVSGSSNGSTRSEAGTVIQVDSDGVWVALGTPAKSLTAPTQGNSVMTFPIAALSTVANADVLARFTPGFAGKVLKTQAFITTAVTTGAKAATLTTKIATVALTGGDVVLAGTYAKGASQAGAAVTAANSFGASDELTVVAGTVTAFVEGAACVVLTIGP